MLEQEALDLIQPNNALWQAMSYFIDIDTLEEARTDMQRTLTFGSSAKLERDQSILSAFLQSQPDPKAVYQFVAWSLNHPVQGECAAFEFLERALAMMQEVLSNFALGS